jgi:hypothetical protein
MICYNSSGEGSPAYGSRVFLRLHGPGFRLQLLGVGAQSLVCKLISSTPSQSMGSLSLQTDFSQFRSDLIGCSLRHDASPLIAPDA